MKLRRPALAAMLAYWAWLVVGYSTESNAVDRPNIIVILADDFGYGSTNAYGADKSLVQTPALDRLAAEGKRFTHAYTESSVCSPTRYALMTGRY
ncbi:MAG: sulfatase-like hydrolase/transferase, partial [Pirellula sp.]